MAGFQHTGGFGSQTADPGSFMATFQPLSKVDMEQPNLVVLWPLTFWDKSGLETADFGSFMEPCEFYTILLFLQL